MPFYDFIASINGDSELFCCAGSRIVFADYEFTLQELPFGGLVHLMR